MIYKKIKDIKPNPDNPRTIRDKNFEKLVNSIKEFPEMLELRPVVVNQDMVILGGNMRYEACKSAGFKEVPIIIADKLTEKKQREFIIKDNVSGGEWDWDLLANEWSTDELNDWGLDVPDWNANEPEIDLSSLDHDLDTYLNNTIRQIVLYYENDLHAQILERLEKVSQREGIEKDNSTTFLRILEYYEQNRD